MLLWTSKTFGCLLEIGLKNLKGTEATSIASESMTSGEYAFVGQQAVLMKLKSLIIIPNPLS